MKAFLKIVSLIAAAVITFFVALGGEEEDKFVRVATMEEASLPIVYMKSGDTVYNRLHGHTGEVDMYSMCEWITILPEDRKLGIRIDKYNSDIAKMSYEVRSKDGSNLYEDTVIKDYTDSQGVIDATLNIKNLLEEKEEYILIIKLATSKYEEVSFYTLIKYDEQADVPRKIELVNEFRAKTFDRENLSSIKKYIETSDEMDNTDFGYVNIHSSLEMFGYGELNVSMEGEPVAYLSQIDKTDAVVYLDFKVSVMEEEEKTYYNVREKYTITQGSSGMYLMDYERYMNQEFAMEGAVKSTSRVYYGISSKEESQVRLDEKEKYTAFVRNGELYMYDARENVLVSIFAFADNESDNVRETYGKHDVLIIDVNEKGDVTFAVYGYMNRGLHEGKMGVSVCNYSYETNDIREVKFVPVTCNFETLKANFGDVSYVDENNTISLMINGTLYAMDTKSNENTVVIDSLGKGDYSVSGDGLKIAYVRDNSIKIYNLVEEKQDVITCGSDEKIKNIGYIGEDFIYGVAKNADIISGADGNDLFPMYKIYIIDKEHKIIKEYGLTGTYVTGFEIVGKRVNLERVKYNEAGVLIRTDDDQLMNKDDSAAPDTAYVRRVATDARLSEMCLQLSNTVSDAKKVELSYANKLKYSDVELKTAIDMAYSDAPRVYEKANMYGKCNTSIRTIEIAFAACEEGESLEQSILIVLNSLGKSADVKAELAKGASAMSLIDECVGITAYNLTGEDLETALQFVAMGSMVIAQTDYDSYVILAGYTKNNVVVYEPVSAKYETFTKAEFEKVTKKQGNVFITYN